MKLEGKMVHILTQIDKDLYKQYVAKENRKSVMYVKLKKSLHSTIQAALLFWKNLTKTLKSWGFKVNPHDWCFADKMLNRKQLAVVWNVDDLKISNVDADVATLLINKLNKRYGKTPRGNDTPLTVKRGKFA